MPETQNGLSLDQIAEITKAFGKDDPDNKVGAHGLTNKERIEIQRKQRAGEELETIPANLNPSYKVKKIEAHLVHILSDRDEWEKGRKLSQPELQMYNVREFEKMSQSVKKEGQKTIPENAFAGRKVEIIHDPRIKTEATAQEDTEQSVKKEGQKTK